MTGISPARRAYQRALELNPNLAEAHHQYGFFLTAMGRHDEAVVSASRAATLDPLSAEFSAGYGRQLYRARRYDEAIEQLQRSLQLAPNRRGTLVFLADAYTWSGQYQEALALIEEEERREGQDLWWQRGVTHAAMGRTEEALEAAKRLEDMGVSSWANAAIYMQVGQSDEAMAVLDRQIKDRTVFPFEFKDPWWDSVHSDPRFHALLEQVGLPVVPLPARHE